MDAHDGVERKSSKTTDSSLWTRQEGSMNQYKGESSQQLLPVFSATFHDATLVFSVIWTGCNKIWAPDHLTNPRKSHHDHRDKIIRLVHTSSDIKERIRAPLDVPLCRGHGYDGLRSVPLGCVRLNRNKDTTCANAERWWNMVPTELESALRQQTRPLLSEFVFSKR